MQFKKSLFLAAALVSTVLADVTEITSSLNATITSTTSVSVASGCTLTSYTATAQSELDDLASCDAIKGDLTIGGDIATASISNIKAIYGDLTVYNATSLTSLTADSITTITGTLSLVDLTILSTASFAELSSVGAVYFVTLPALSSISLTTGITDAESIYISDTYLSSLDGFDATNVETFNINNNKNLDTIESSIETISSALDISYNSEDVDVKFDDLIWANNITFRDIASVSLSNLTTVNASLGFISSVMESIKVNSVETIGGTLTIENNEKLTELDFSKLTSIAGGFVIVNNTDLDTIDGFDDLETVGGAVEFEGSFSNASLPALKTVRGGFIVETDGDLDCTEFNDLDSDGVIEGDKYVCSAASSSTSTTGTATSGASTSTGSSSDSSSSSSSSSSTAAAAGNSAVASLSIFGTFVAIALSLL
ncbi:hypothetical protein PACTADRAFT_1544 [Pachysolen tannophilus NRRL Y-2460]|uniref:Receptor L-domain domain-containing protein n=1 Tax=Pachysolen tannophilus NRRL Y-2460 TaxID=669874 RepID=A0A1E4TYZ3_PACTA|nr:hypothetical protein PACTADRAFT_1544 [Pachysolen tannophilus NRRL Y-2460]